MYNDVIKIRGLYYHYVTIFIAQFLSQCFVLLDSKASVVDHFRKIEM